MADTPQIPRETPNSPHNSPPDYSELVCHAREEADAWVQASEFAGHSTPKDFYKGAMGTAEILRELAAAVEDLQAKLNLSEKALRATQHQRSAVANHLGRAMKTLMGIHHLLYPPRPTANGVTLQFRSPHVHEQMQELSDRIRAIPDEIAAIEAGEV